MNYDIYAVVCGLIRNELEFDSIISRLIELREAGKIKGIIVSTWDNEFDNKTLIRNKIVNSGIAIVESPPLSQELGLNGNLSYYRQAKQLENAIKGLPDDSFILKCRTDMSSSELNEFFLTFDIKYMKIKKRNIFNIDFSYKINVMKLGMSHLFGLNDLLFMGYKADILKMINYDCVKLHYPEPASSVSASSR